LKKEVTYLDSEGKDKIERVLGIYTKLMNGDVVNKSEEAARYGVNERSIQRDIDDIRNYLDSAVEDNGVANTIIYDRKRKGHRLEQIYQLKLTNSEILAICKILLDSRGLRKKEMTDILDKLISCCVPEDNRKLVTELISNEKFHYIEPRHKKNSLISCGILHWQSESAVISRLIISGRKIRRLLRAN
jgi:predicted DNA-binding transcriptional regulator YafY